MLVSMDQITGAYDQAPYLNRRTGCFHMNVRMGNQGAGGKVGKAQCIRFIEVAHSAVGYHPHASQRLVHSGLHLTPERADGLFINILNNRDRGGGTVKDGLVVRKQRLLVLLGSRIAGTDLGSAGVSDNRFSIRIESFDGRGCIALGLASEFEFFDGVAHRRGIELPEFFQLSFCQIFH